MPASPSKTVIKPGTEPMLSEFQQQLEDIYEIRPGVQVMDFLVTDPQTLQRFDMQDGRDTPEKLLLRQQGDDLDMALYLDRALLQALEHDNPLDQLHEGNLNDFLIMLEGVSHFLYMAWNAIHDREVSLFELELQAEVDKYVAAVFLLASQQHRRIPRRLCRQLFDRPCFRQDLSLPELRRYGRANRYARNYCQSIHRACIELKRHSLVNEVRRFYRLTSHHKLRHINLTPAHI